MLCSSFLFGGESFAMGKEDGISCSSQQNISIAGDNSNSGNQYIGQNINVNDTRDRISVEARRTKIKNMGINRRQIFNFGGFLTFLGFMGNCISIYGLFSSTFITITAIFLLFLGFMLISIGAYFLNNTEYRSSLLGSIETDNLGNLYLTDLTAPCPFCSGQMRLYPGGKYEPSPMLVCNRASRNHRLHFDMATLPNVSEDHPT